MNDLKIAGAVLVFVACGASLGMFFRKRMAEHHFSADTKDVLKLGTGLVCTLFAIVLGLLISTAKGSFDNQNAQIRQIAANVVLLDILLAEYGPEARPIRDDLRRSHTELIERIWHNGGANGSAGFAPTRQAEALWFNIRSLPETNEPQQFAKQRATQTVLDISKARLLLLAQQGGSIPLPFVVTTTFWLFLIFFFFSLFAKPGAFVAAVLFAFAVSAAGAMLLFLALDHPFSGLL